MKAIRISIKYEELFGEYVLAFLKKKERKGCPD